MSCMLYVTGYFSENMDDLESAFILYEINAKREEERGIPEWPIYRVTNLGCIWIGITSN